MEIVNQLMSSLGVKEDQAKGAAGLLFSLAKDKLSGDEFGQVAQHVDGMDSLLQAAPKSEGVMSAIGGLASSLGGKAGGLGKLAGLVGGFDKLGLDSDMIGKFVPVILSFVQSKGGDGIKAMLAKVFE